MPKKKTAQDAIAQGRRLTAGLHVAAGNFTIGEEILENLNQKIRKEQEKKYQSMLKLKAEYDNLLVEVNAVKALNKTPEQWSAAQVRTMVKWYKCGEDNALPSKKADLLTRYYAPCNGGDWVPPPLPKELLLPPSDEVLLSISLDDNEQSDDILLELAV